MQVICISPLILALIISKKDKVCKTFESRSHPYSPVNFY